MTQEINTLTPDMIRKLLPTTFPTIRRKPKSGGLSPLVNNLLPTIQRIKDTYIQLKFGSIVGQKAENDYGMYLQFPNSKIKSLAATIVKPTDSNDEKTYKIMAWIQENIEYKSDIKNYGVGEFWALPTLTATKKSGDCEDGAFLMHSLMLNAGVPWDKVRTYGGMVFAGVGATTGGHGWTSYKRETDDEWVVLDWSYYPEKTPIAERTPMKDDIRYIDDFFYVDAIRTVETPYSNKVKNPGMAAYNTEKYQYFIKGQRLNTTLNTTM